MRELSYLLTFLLLGSMTLSCSDNLKDPLVIGHRGAMGHETENTLASVQKALDLRVDMIEIDVFRIISGEIVVFHDERLERLSNGGGRIEDYNVVAVKNLMLKGNHRIPMLQDVLRLIDKKADLNVELKGAGTAERVNFILGRYIENNGWTLDRFLVSSFNWDELRDLRTHNKEIAIAVLTEDDPLEAIPVARELNATSINADHKTLTVEIVDAIHQAGFKVYAWTANDPEDINRLKKIGVDGIFSDYPERIK
jgi:glycerophosphoryl diester phosphodiesterase